MSAHLRGSRAAALLLVLCAPSAARAIPAFARRYGTSCQTCHVAYPKNTPFGEAFRRNGHHFPGGDEDVQRDAPQKLGADANKDLFPQAVWPGELPFNVPVSVATAATLGLKPGAGMNGVQALAGTYLAINAAASFGDHFSAWAGARLTAGTDGIVAASLERVFLTVTPFSRPWALLRAGLFEPSLLSFSLHRTLGPAPWLLTTTVGDDPSAPEAAQLGAELAGVLGGRFAWALGLVDGAGRVDVPNDVYGRLGYKLGGLRLDGHTGEEEAANPAPWREWSVQAGAFGYWGSARLGLPEVASQEDRFWTVGGDVNALLGDANLVVAYSYSRHARPFLARPSRAGELHQVFAQLDYVVFPWLVPTARFEWRMLNRQPEQRYSLGAYLLIRANLRLHLLAAAAYSGGKGFTFDSGQAGLAAAF